MPQIRYAVEQRLFLAQLYFTSESAGKCHGKFQCHFPGKPLPGKQIWSVSWKQQDCWCIKGPTGNELCWQKRNWTLFMLGLKLHQIVGHQWYWSYEYLDFTKLKFDSYIVQEEDQQTTTFRLPDTDNRVVLPVNSPIWIIVTASDVLHSWTAPRLGVKTDATPGWLNQVRFSINRPGLLFQVTSVANKGCTKDNKVN